MANSLTKDLSNLSEEGEGRIKEIAGDPLTPEQQANIAKIPTIEANQTTVNEIKEVMQSLPDGQTVSAQVAVNTEKLSELEKKTEEIHHIEDNIDNFVEITIDAEGKLLKSTDNKGNVRLYHNIYVDGSIEGKTIAEIKELIHFNYTEIYNISESIKKETDRAISVEKQKVDKVDGKELANTELLNSIYINNFESYSEAVTDADDRIIYYVDKEGVFYHETKQVFNDGINISEHEFSSIDDNEFIEISIDAENRIIEGTRKDGTKVFNSSIESPTINKLKDSIPTDEHIEEVIANKLQSDEYDFNLASIVDIIGLDVFKNKLLTVVKPYEYSCWPFIGTYKNKYFVMYSLADKHLATRTYLYYTTSDNGIVWNKPKPMFLPLENVRKEVIGCGNDNDGNLLIWRKNGNTPLLYKFDGSWHQFASVQMPYNPHISDIFSLEDGTLMCMYNTYRYSGSTSIGGEWGYLKSINNGETWSYTEVGKEDANNNPCEISAQYLGNGRILAIGRTEGGNMVQLQSTDYGQTWTNQQTNVPSKGSTPSIIVDGNSVKLYYYHRNSGEMRYINTTLDAVWDNPTSWANHSVLVKGNTGYDSGNVHSIKMFNNNILLIFYMGTSELTGIFGLIN